MALFILLKRRGSKRFSGFIPTRKGSTRKSLRGVISKKLKKGFMARVVTGNQLKKIIQRQKPRKIVKRRNVKRR